MSPEERQLLTALFDRVRTATTTARDAEAEAFIAEATRAEPAAPYYLAQAVIVQEKGLEAAGNHIRQLEERVRQLEAREAEKPADSNEGGFLASLFGSRREPDRSDRPAPRADAASFAQTVRQPQAPTDAAGRPGGAAPSWAAARQDQGAAIGGGAPAYAGPWSRQAAPAAGGSFLAGAATTAAGVAGGMLLANGLAHVFGSQFGGIGSQTAGVTQPVVEETVINNNDGTPAPQAEPQQGDAQQSDGGWQTADNGDANDPGYDSGDFGGGDFGGDSFDV